MIVSSYCVTKQSGYIGADGTAGPVCQVDSKRCSAMSDIALFFRSSLVERQTNSLEMQVRFLSKKPNLWTSNPQLTSKRYQTKLGCWGWHRVWPDPKEGISCREGPTPDLSRYHRRKSVVPSLRPMGSRSHPCRSGRQDLSLVIYPQGSEPCRLRPHPTHIHR